MIDDSDDLGKQIEDAERLIGEVKKETDEALEPFVPVEPLNVQEPVIEEPELEDENVKLVRKVQTLESELTGKMSKIDEALEFLKNRIIENQKEPELTLEPEEELPDDATPYEINEYLKKERARILDALEQRDVLKARKAEEEKNSYSKKYAEMIGTLNQDITPEVFKAMTDTKDITYNKVITGDPEKDFYINYRNATENIHSRENKKVVYGKASNVPTGVNVPNSTIVSGKSFDRSKLSPLEQEVARMLSDEDLSSLSVN